VAGLRGEIDAAYSAKREEYVILLRGAAPPYVAVDFFWMENADGDDVFVEKRNG
jgi:hypothetical protein